MRDINTIRQELSQLNLQIQNLRERTKVNFKSDLKDLLEEYKGKFDRLDISLNNHEFNDGDATYFGLHYEDMTLVYSDELGNEIEQSSYGDKDNPDMESIRMKFVELFKAYDIADLYESLYGDDYESITIEALR